MRPMISSLKLLSVVLLSFAPLACTSTVTDETNQPQEAVQTSLEEPKSLLDTDSSTIIDEPSPAENAALAEATSPDFNDPKDVQLADTTPTAEVQEPAAVDTAGPDLAANDTALLADDSSSTLASPVASEGTSISTDTGHAVEPVLFGKNRSTISKAEKAKLKSLVKQLKADRNLKIVVAGHCDTKGSAAYNKRLAMKRAKAVKRYLVSKGVRAKQVTVESFGSEKLVAFGETEQDQKLNRRVEISFL